MTYAAIGNKHTAQRMVHAETTFIESLMRTASISEEEGEKVLKFYRKIKAVKMDIVGGTITVKHGAFWDIDVIRRALISA